VQGSARYQRLNTPEGAPEEDEYNVLLFPFVPGGQEDTSNHGRYVRDPSEGIQTPPLLFLADEATLQLKDRTITLRLRGCLTSSAPGVLAPPVELDQLPDPGVLSNALSENMAVWNDTLFCGSSTHRAHWNTERARSVLAHQMTGDLAVHFYRYANSEELHGFNDNLPALECSCNVPAQAEHISAFKVHWTPVRCGSSPWRP
jgi:hypothetical protein